MAKRKDDPSPVSPNLPANKPNAVAVEAAGSASAPPVIGTGSRPTSNDPPATQGAFALSAYEGPIPSPEQLAAYAAIDPQLPARLIKLTEDAYQDARAMQRDHLKAMIEDTKSHRLQNMRGQYLGFGLGMTGLIAGTVAIIMTGTTAGATAGGAIAGVTLASMVIAFLRNGPQPQPPGEEQRADRKRADGR